MANNNPMGIVVVGPDVHCPKCGELLVHINEAGEPEGTARCTGFTIGGKMPEGDGPPLGEVIDAECEKCNPELGSQHPFDRLPAPVREVLGRMLRQRQGAPDEQPDNRIKLPWE